MHHYRQALMRMRQGDSDRDIARSRLMGRRSAAAFRAMAGGSSVQSDVALRRQLRQLEEVIEGHQRTRGSRRAAPVYIRR